MRSSAYGDPFPNQTLKVGLIGSHCTGKTSAGELLSQMTGFPLLKEGIRDVVHLMGYTQIPDVPDQALMQWNILRNQLNQEEEVARLASAYNRKVAFITDRTTLDNAAYFKLYQQGKIADIEYRRYMDESMVHATNAYTHLIYFPIRWHHIEADGFRDTDPVGRERVDEIVRDLLYQYGLKDRVYTVDVDRACEDPHTTIERCTNIMNHLGLWPRLRELGLA